MDDETDLPRPGSPGSSDEETVKGDKEEDHTISDMLEEEIQSPSTPVRVENGASLNRYHRVLDEHSDLASQDGSSMDGLPRRVRSPVDSLMSIPDDSPSVQGSVVSSPSSSVLPSVASRPGLNSPTPSFRPFDRRFSARIASPSILSPRPSSPAFLSAHSRNASLSSQFLFDQGDTESPSPPWEVVRWTKLRKLNGQAFSEAGKRNFGSPTCIVVSASIVLGTSKGIILMFDYNQNLKMILGPGTKAVESGAITSIAISADHSTVAGGHASGSIFTWDTSRASRPFLHIPHLDASQLTNRTQDGHLPNVAITSLGFLGTRHTALVSADDRGMAFSHLATRGTGSLGRTVKTTRILGRYPGSQPPSAKPIKPSTVLAFASLPLGNIERASDNMGLTAMLTPYLLVIVSTTPVANTQHKSPRPKEVAPHSAMSGCLAWFPAVKLKTPDPKTGSQISKVKLVYCWSNVLTVLDVDEIPVEDKDKPPSLTFKARSRWRCEEAIVAVQWLSRSVIAVLTISQRLIVIEDQSMRMTEAFDLIHKYIYHADLFSKQLHALVEQLDEEDTSMHGVVADAFSMSFKTYKGRIFLLGFNDVSIGSLSNWADRLIALMENGDYMGAIQLATLYYTGDADKLTIGLPEDSELRHSMVQEKLMEIMSASLKYAFNQRQKNPAKIDDSHLQELAQACFVACQSVGDVDFLFDEMYEWFEEGDVEGIFLETLEPYILDRTVTVVPPAVVKALVTHFVTKGWESRLEELICQMETATLDLDEITTLCKQHGLYDALIYVWNQAMNDFITPLIDLLTLLVPHMQGGEYVAGNEMEQDFYGMNAFKIFPYLSYVLTGRVYPTEERMPEDVQSKAKAEIYWFLFSGKTIAWPKGSDKAFRTRPAEASEPSFPYLRMILKFDAASFLSLLNEAFEDPFLNESPEKHLNGGTSRDLPEEQIFGLTVDRQYIVSILLEIMNPADFAVDATIYLDMFIARNLPTYSQYLILPGSTLTKVLTGLCNYPGSDLAEDAQLSAEYLLSVYQPPDISALIPLFKQAGFYRILKRIYKHDEQYGKLLETYFEDPDDRESTYKAIADCLRPQTGLSKRQLHDVHQVIREHSRELVEFDPVESAKTLGRFAPELHPHVLQTVSDEPSLQFTYLRTILEPEDAHAPAVKGDRDLIEQYVRLMCEFDSAHVSEYVGLVQSADLRLDQLLPTMEKTGVVDGAVILMAREGQIQESMGRLIKHLHTLESALQGLFAGEESDETDLHSAAEDLIKALQKYVHVGLWLCQKQTKMHKSLGTQTRQESPSNEALTPDEMLWLSLIDTTVQITRNIMPAIQSAPSRRRRPSNASGTTDDEDFSRKGIDTDQLAALLRTIVQHTFTALLTATSSHTAPQGPATRTASSSASNLSFLRILRAFLTRAAESSPSLADLRSVISSIFSAYAYEESILQLSNRLLERSLFVNVKKAVELRQRGWRAKGSTCEACGRRVWGPGLQGNVYEAYEQKQTQDQERRAARRALTRGVSDDRGKGKADGSGDVSDGECGGKGKGKAAHGIQDGNAGVNTSEGTGEHAGDGHANGGTVEPAAAKDQGLGPLVIFACRHIYHRNCLEAIRAQNENKPGGRRYSIDFGGKEREYRDLHYRGQKLTTGANQRPGNLSISPPFARLYHVKGSNNNNNNNAATAIGTPEHERAMSMSSEEDDRILSENQSDHPSLDSSSGDDISDGEDDVPPPPLTHNFAPPFYGRPPTPLPPSPSLTSLLRPSRPTTPDASDDELEPVPRASPKVPTYEYYGFVLYLFSSFTFLMYLLWSYLPSPFLHALGIYYYPNRWWSLAIPSFLVMLIVYIYIALASYNTEILTLPMSNIETIVDDAAKVAVVDSRGRLRHFNKGGGGNNAGGNGGGPRRKRDKQSREERRAERASRRGELDWKSLWNEGTDAVMDVPLAGVCEVLYGGIEDDDDEVLC